MKIWSIFRNGKEISEDLRVSEAEGYNVNSAAPWILFCGRHLEFGGIIKNNDVDSFIKEAMEMGYEVKEIN